VGTITAAGREAEQVRVPSRTAAEMYADLMALPPEWRREWYAGLDKPDLVQLLAVAKKQGGSAYALWQDDPVGFYEDVLGETIWSKQREVLLALCNPGVKRIVVPAGFGLGKTHVAGGAVAWFGSVWPVGTAITVTTATRLRQVQRQLWPHVRRLVAKADLPGDCDTLQWKQPDGNGVETVVAYGFTAPEHDEAAMQGIHAPKMFLVVDEAGGIGHTIGSSTRNLLTGDARMLAIGNPPTDDEGSWFEGASVDGDDPERADTVTVRIAAWDSPAVTGEQAICRACPPQVPEHQLGTHLVDGPWIEEAVREHGRDAPYVVAKVDAKFPRGGSARAIPSSHVDAGQEALLTQVPDPEDLPDAPVSVDSKGRPYPQQPTLGAWIRLGVDVAADGGDELVVARDEGGIGRIRLVQSGAANVNATDVAGKILEEILAAERLAAALGSERQVEVKVDSIGVGWGVVGVLEAWGTEGLHSSKIIRVNVAENPQRPDDPKAQWRPFRKRDELWLNGRELLTPDPAGRTAWRLDVDTRTAAQLSTPTYGTNASGKTVIESKKAMKARGVNSPDRAEALLLAVYSPVIRRKKRKRLLA